MEVKRLLTAAALAAACLCSSSADGEVSVSDLDNKPIAVMGTFRLVGNEPFSRLVVLSEDGDEYLTPFRTRVPTEWRALIGKRIRVTGSVREQAIRTAGGKTLGVEKVLLIDSMELAVEGGNNDKRPE